MSGLRADAWEQEPDWDDAPGPKLVSEPSKKPARPVGTTLPVLGRAAYHGIAGQFLDAVHGKTEAHPAALLVTFLAGFGNMLGDPIAMGGHPVVSVADTEHTPRIFAALVGPTAQGGKGLSLGTPMAILRALDERWFVDCIQTGLSTGEGLIHAIRDGGTPDPNNPRVAVDPGVMDKRLFFELQEFGRLLAVKSREGNTLGHVLSEAWDGNRPLKVATKSHPLTATRPYVSGIAHVTPEELVAKLTETDQANGFANRFLWVYTKRVMDLPRPPKFPLSSPILKELHQTVEWAGTLIEDWHMEWTLEGGKKWDAVYSDLRQVPAGFMGAMQARACPQVLRLTMLYALLDRTLLMRPEHLAAALAIWAYSVASLKVIYQSPTGNPVADKILDALRAVGSMTKADAYNKLFRRHVLAVELEEALALLVAGFGVKVAPSKGLGRSGELWSLG